MSAHHLALGGGHGLAPFLGHHAGVWRAEPGGDGGGPGGGAGAGPGWPRVVVGPGFVVSVRRRARRRRSGGRRARTAPGLPWRRS